MSGSIYRRKAIVARMCAHEGFEVDGTNIHGDMFEPITNNIMGLVHRVMERTLVTSYYVAKTPLSLEDFREQVVKEFFGED